MGFILNGKKCPRNQRKTFLIHFNPQKIPLFSTLKMVISYRPLVHSFLGSHDPFGHLKHKLWPKKKWGVKSARPLKVGNYLDFVACRWRATYRLKDLNKGYKFALDLISIRGLHTKLWAPKSQESHLWEFRDSHLGVPRQNDIWVLVSWPGTKYIIRGKVMVSLKFELWWILWVRICLSFVLAPKVFQLCTNQLVVWFCAGPCEWLNACHSS